MDLGFRVRTYVSCCSQQLLFRPRRPKLEQVISCSPVAGVFGIKDSRI